MLKLIAVVSLVLIATWSQADSRRSKKEVSDSSDFRSGSTMWAASLSCESCGSECASACGTRHFRSCCFNYLRRKRGSDEVKFLSSNEQDLKPPTENMPKHKKQKLPVFIMENVPEQWVTNIVANEYIPYPYEDTVDNRLLDM